MLLHIAIWQFLNHVVKATVFMTQCDLGQMFYLEDFWILRQHIVSVHRIPFIEVTRAEAVLETRGSAPMVRPPTASTVSGLGIGSRMRS
jgi:hypothetical protein